MLINVSVSQYVRIENSNSPKVSLLDPSSTVPPVPEFYTMEEIGNYDDITVEQTL